MNFFLISMERSAKRNEILSSALTCAFIVLERDSADYKEAKNCTLKSREFFSSFFCNGGKSLLNNATGLLIRTGLVRVTFVQN